MNEFIDSPINESLLDNNKWEVDTNSYCSTYTKKYIYKNSLIKTSEGCFFSSIIADRDIMLSNNIHIGLSKKEFEAKFINLTNNKQSPFIENTPTHIRFGENQLKNDYWNFEFNNDTLVLITYLSK